MKNNLIKTVYSFTALVFSMILITSCSDNSANVSNDPPVITSVAASVIDAIGTPSDLSPITQGYANNVYIIRGTGFATTQKIYFNGTSATFNPNFVTNTEIFVTIDINTPYANASDELKVVTKNGTAVYHFVVAPPAPIVSSVNPINTADGTDITIKGNYFLNPVVKFGTVTATVVSNTLTEIHATLPVGSQLKTVSVTTISGTDTYGSAIGTALYDDAFYNGITAGGWGETHDLANTTDVIQGDKAMKCTISAWSGFQFDGYVPVVATATGLRFKMKMKTAGQIRLVFNSDWGHQYYINISDKYQDYSVTWDKFGLTGPPVAFQSLVFGSTGADNVFYIDDFGYKLN